MGRSQLRLFYFTDRPTPQKCLATNPPCLKSTDRGLRLLNWNESRLRLLKLRRLRLWLHDSPASAHVWPQRDYTILLKTWPVMSSIHSSKSHQDINYLHFEQCLVNKYSMPGGPEFVTFLSCVQINYNACFSCPKHERHFQKQDLCLLVPYTYMLVMYGQKH